MRFLLLPALGLLLLGCSSRVPLAVIHVHVDLDKQAYKTLVERAGTSAVGVGAGAGAAFGSDGSRGFGLGVGVSVPLTTEVRLVGLDRDNLEREVFSGEVKWGANDLDLKVYGPRAMVILAGDGPGGRLRRHVGDIDLATAAPGGYALRLTSPDGPLQLEARPAPAAPPATTTPSPPIAR